MYKKDKTFTLFIMVVYIITAFCWYNVGKMSIIAEPKIEEVVSLSVSEEPSAPIEIDPIILEVETVEDIIIEPYVEPISTHNQVSDSDISLLALVTMAEAEGECEEGKRLVIDTILNRVDSDHFPDTIYDVVYQQNQFSSMWNGRVNRCEVRDDIYNLVLEELQSRTNYEVIFFTAGRYSAYGTPMFRVENHHFSKY